MEAAEPGWLAELGRGGTLCIFASARKTERWFVSVLE